MNFLRQFGGFVVQVRGDARIPSRDKKLLLLLALLVISPLDLIFGWNSVWNLLLDVFCIALISDYLFNVIDDVLLSHYPWGMKSFVAIRRTVRPLANLVPFFLRSRLWKFTVSPYRARI